MTIGDFNKIALQSTQPQMVVGHDDNQRTSLREPLNPPGAWTQFKAALSSVPLLGQMGSLQQARQEVDSYPVRLAQYEVSNRQILAGFVQDLRENYGDRVADMAMRSVDVNDGAPLSQRMVKTAIDSAEQAQKQQRAMNNMQVTRFVESPLQGGTRLPGETDMTALFLERNLPLNGQPSWQQALGPGGAKFVSQLTEGLCRALPDHARQALTNGQIATAANQALDTYQSLLATPDMTPARLEDVLVRATQKSGHQAMLAHARELAVTDRLEIQLNRKDPESLLSRTAAAVQRSMQAEVDALGLPPPGLDLGPVLKSIGGGINETVSFGMREMAKELGCSDDAPSIARALDGVLPGKMETAVREHIQALTLIQQSPTLTDSQKTELMAIAQTRRIDAVQVQKYEAVAGAISQAMTALREYAQGGADPQAVFARLDTALARYETDVVAMKEHGATMWEHGSLSGGDMTIELMQQFANVAAHGLSEEDGQALHTQIHSPAVGTLAQVMQQSSDMRTAGQLPIVLSTLLQAVAQRAGHAPEEAQQQVRALLAEPPTGLDVGALPPHLALTLLTDPEKNDGHGVDRTSPNAHLIAPDFDPATLMAQNRQTLRDYVNSDGIDGESGLPKTTIKDMGRATFCLNNQRIGTPGAPGGEVRDRFESAFDSAPLARGVARCMNQLGINMFVELNNKAAYGQDNTLAHTSGIGTTMHEAWQQDDGSWLVRSSHTQRPAVLVTPDGHMTTVQSDGLAAFSLTYRVTPGATPGDEAVITLQDSQVGYAI
jgi:hypothetical protein